MKFAGRVMASRMIILTNAVAVECFPRYSRIDSFLHCAPAIDELAILVGASAHNHQTAGFAAERPQLVQTLARGGQRVAQDSRHLGDIVGGELAFVQEIVENVVDLWMMM